MDNSKRNVHNSGPLGILVKSGQVKKMAISSSPVDPSSQVSVATSYFKTQSGIEFTDNELIFVDPKTCEPWKYANRQEDELGEMAELIESIKCNKQLQPALVRKHPHPHNGIIYEVIFGRRRHLACLNLGIPFLVICKEISNDQDAIQVQDAENKYRKDISPYSNALLYQKLLNDGLFKTEKELAEKLRMPASTLNDLLVFSKLPIELVSKIPNIHSLSKNFALKLMNSLKQSPQSYSIVLEVAPLIGDVISSPAKFDLFLKKKLKISSSSSITEKTETKLFFSDKGEKLFTFKFDQRGSPCFVLHKKIMSHLNLANVCESIQNLLETHLNLSGYPD